MHRTKFKVKLDPAIYCSCEHSLSHGRQNLFANSLLANYYRTKSTIYSFSHYAIQPTTYQLILISRDCCKDRLWENICTILFSLKVGDRAAMFPPLDEVYPRLVPVHGVQHDLKPEEKEDRKCT